MTCQGSRLRTTTLWNILGDSLYEFSMPSGKNEVTHHLNIVSCFPFRVSSHPSLWSVLIYISKNFQNKEKALKRPFQPSHKRDVSLRFQLFSPPPPFYVSRGLKRQPEKNVFANYYLIILNRNWSLCFVIFAIWQPSVSKKCVLMWDLGSACK